MKPTVKFVAAMLVVTLALALGATVLLVTVPHALAVVPSPGISSLPDGAWGAGLMAAALATAVAALGAGFAVAKVGTAAIGALAEKPELFGRLLIFVGLAEGIAIYGLIVSILILNRLV